MHVISRKPFADAMKKYPDCSDAIDSAYNVLVRSDFKNPQELKAMFCSLEKCSYKNQWWIIDIGVNHLKMLAFIEFRHSRIHVKHIVSHREFDVLCKKIGVLNGRYR